MYIHKYIILKKIKILPRIKEGKEYYNHPLQKYKAEVGLLKTLELLAIQNNARKDMKKYIFYVI
jgi:hypothetical protein